MLLKVVCIKYALLVNKDMPSTFVWETW
jgi:hypothetical protein